MLRNSHLAVPPHAINIFVVGCGATGSFLIRDLMSVHLALKSLNHPGIELTLIDFDKVEQRNVGPQMFTQHDIGQYKADVLAERYSDLFGVNINTYVNRIESFVFPSYGLVVGCVDNYTARLCILNKTKNNFDLWYFDIGNDDTYGQFYFCDQDDNIIRYIQSSNILPMPEGVSGNCDSFINIPFVESLFINRQMASLAATELFYVLRTGNLRRKRIFYNAKELLIAHNE